MKELLQNLSKKDQWLIGGLGFTFFVLYAILLWFRPQESWIDETYFSDWARQLAENNWYYTICGEVGRPTHCPLYTLLMALWLKAVGFSYFSYHIVNIIFALITYWLLSLILVGRKYIASWHGIVGITMLYWFAPTLCWTIGCGRTEILCLLLGVLTAYSFVQAIETHEWKHRIGLFVYSLLLFATGIEGVLFATIFILVYSVFYWKEAWKNKILYVYHFGGYLASLVGLSVMMLKLQCLHQFYDKMFGYSQTFSSVYQYVRAVVKNAKHGEIVQNVPSVSHADNSFVDSLWQGISMNPEYLAMIGVVIVLLIVLVCLRKIEKIQKPTWVMITMAVLTPFVFTVAGRYPLYYTWAALIPCIVALVMVIEQTEIKWLHLILGLSMAVWFCISPQNKRMRTLDWTHEQDKRNIEEIRQAQINPSEGTCIPYSWYYYIVEENDNIWFQTSRERLEDIKVIVYNPDDYNEDAFMDMFMLEERGRVGKKIIYNVVELKTDNSK